MKRTYILTPDFDKAWSGMGLGDDELQLLQQVLNKDPEIGTVIPGLGGARKVRIPLEGRGKSGGGRVVYVDIVVKEQIYLLAAYAKNVQTDLDPDQKKVIRKMVEIIKEE
ncbi:type II toxin-antitoxin system RelE/ParE family toxin [uncultured Oscillibacter sp.]|uniref:type II toxin-antitoxin system RelE/ParE family toxin n=1 Tax=uncultured Oscillibacter sp. TaxID=876091 RepID=UPI00272D3DB5|nr:type II toxin-antitoxin system RelE/ParE family toxin [uncultured Oscillibacter sp.]